MCGLHKQNVNGLLTIDLHLGKAKNQGQNMAFFFPEQFSGKKAIW